MMRDAYAWAFSEKCSPEKPQNKKLELSSWIRQCLEFQPIETNAFLKGGCLRFEMFSVYDVTSCNGQEKELSTIIAHIHTFLNFGKLLQRRHECIA